MPTNNYQVAPIDVGGIFGMAAAKEQQNHQAQQRAQSGAMGGLFGLARTLGGAAIAGPFGASLGGMLGRGAGNRFTY